MIFQNPYVQKLMSVHIATKFMYILSYMSATIYEVRTCIPQQIMKLHKYTLIGWNLWAKQISGCQCKNMIILLKYLCIKKQIVHQIHVCPVMHDRCGTCIQQIYLMRWWATSSQDSFGRKSLAYIITVLHSSLKHNCIQIIDSAFLRLL